MVAVLTVFVLVAVAFVSVASSLNSYSGKRFLWRNAPDEPLPEETDWEVT